MPLYPRLEVCRDFLCDRCERDDDSCRYAHPPAHISVTNGRVICCTDFLQNRCERDNPPCRYFHPPEHLKKQLKSERYSGDERSNRSPRYRSQRNRSPPRYQNDKNYNNYRNVNNFNGDYDERFQSNNNEMVFGNAVVNTLLPQLLLLKEQILNGLNGGLNGGNLETALYNYKALTNSGRSGGDDFNYGSGDWSRDPSPRRNDKKDATFEVCRDFRKGFCTRNDCRFAHPPSNIQVDRDNRVTICLNDLRNKCTYEDCRYFHLPDHLKNSYLKKGEAQGGYRKRRSSFNTDDSKRRRRY